MMLELQPINYNEASQFINKHHRHHLAPQGWKFGIAVNDGEQIVGVITVGRPVARHFDYGAAWRAARAMGYKRIITYTLISEGGSSLKASDYKVVHQTKGGSWSREGRIRLDKHPLQEKSLWEKRI
jgi:hypothetical protein